MKRSSLIVLGLMAVLSGCSRQSEENAQAPAADTIIQAAIPEPRSVTGAFLASHFAQSQYDWKTADKYLEQVMEADPGNAELVKRAMILAVGSGDMPRAALRAKELVKADPKDGLALLVLSVNALTTGDPAGASSFLKAMPEGDLTSFIKPLLLGWVRAGEGKLEKADLNETFIHNYHYACMALMLGKTDIAKNAVRRMIDGSELPTYDAERVGDLLAAVGETEDALSVYRSLGEQNGTSGDLNRKIEALQGGGGIEALLPPLRIKTPAQGAAMAMYDMAFVLYQEYSDTSAKIFAQMAHALDPSMSEAQVLLGDILARNGRYDEAITYFSSIPKTDHSYLASQRHAADLLAEAGRDSEARALLNKLFTENNDTEALIRIGDLYRQQENYGSALKIYNQAADHIGGKIPEKYWYLLYARGMAYEREGEWSKAESDLKAALGYRPDNPYLMNYLGYGWADQGINLDQSLALIRRAVSLRPTDGYITDSLGWVLYMMGQYEDAIPHLERAVELLPYDPTINDHLGDAYWRTGRRLEARFQWERARSNAGPEDGELKTVIAQKLENGLGSPDKVKAASILPIAPDASVKGAMAR